MVNEEQSVLFYTEIFCQSVISSTSSSDVLLVPREIKQSTLAQSRKGISLAKMLFQEL